MLLHMETNIFQGLLYSICEGFNSLFSSRNQKKVLSDDMPKIMSVVSFSIKKQSGYPD